MEMLAKMIAALRREQGVTQEALAERIGVSPQTVSKWETGTNCPDVALLPILADEFGVSIDTLYGRQAAQRALQPGEAIDRVIEAVRETVVATVYSPELDGRFEDQLAQYKRVMQSDPRQRSVIENERDVLYFRETLGALALRKPEEGWNSLFGNDDVAVLLRLLADDDFRRAMQHIISRRVLTFTLPSLAKQCGIADCAALEEKLMSSGLFARRELLLDESPLTYFELVGGESKLFLLYAVLAFAKELAEHQSVHYCFIGNMNYFTP